MFINIERTMKIPLLRQKMNNLRQYYIIIR